LGKIFLLALKQVLVTNAGVGSVGAFTKEEVEDVSTQCKYCLHGRLLGWPHHSLIEVIKIMIERYVMGVSLLVKNLSQLGGSLEKVLL
jgi:hypothetical protein